jgi:hypothetical protein
LVKFNVFFGIFNFFFFRIINFEFSSLSHLVSREELLSNLQQQANREQLLAAANCPPWLMGTAVAQQQQTIGGMSNALLTALVKSI